MKDLILTGETLTSSILVMPKSSLVIADKMGMVRNKEGIVVGKTDKSFNVDKRIREDLKTGNVTNSSGIVICSSDELKNLDDVSEYM